MKTIYHPAEPSDKGMSSWFYAEYRPYPLNLYIGKGTNKHNIPFLVLELSFYEVNFLELRTYNEGEGVHSYERYLGLVDKAFIPRSKNYRDFEIKEEDVNHLVEHLFAEIHGKEMLTFFDEIYQRGYSCGDKDRAKTIRKTLGLLE